MKQNLKYLLWDYDDGGMCICDNLSDIADFIETEIAERELPQDNFRVFEITRELTFDVISTKFKVKFKV